MSDPEAEGAPGDHKGGWLGDTWGAMSSGGPSSLGSSQILYEEACIEGGQPRALVQQFSKNWDVHTSLGSPGQRPNGSHPWDFHLRIDWILMVLKTRGLKDDAT